MKELCLNVKTVSKRTVPFGNVLNLFAAVLNIYTAKRKTCRCIWSCRWVGTCRQCGSSVLRGKKKKIELTTKANYCYLIANVSSAKLPSRAVAISHQQHFIHFDSVFFIQHCVAITFSDALFAFEIKEEQMLENVVAEIHLIAGREPLYCRGKAPLDKKRRIWPISKMRRNDFLSIFIRRLFP